MQNDLQRHILSQFQTMQLCMPLKVAEDSAFNYFLGVCPCAFSAREGQAPVLKTLWAIEKTRRSGHFRYFLIFSTIKIDFLHFLSS